MVVAAPSHTAAEPTPPPSDLHPEDDGNYQDPDDGKKIFGDILYCNSVFSQFDQGRFFTKSFFSHLELELGPLATMSILS